VLCRSADSVKAPAALVKETREAVKDILRKYGAQLDLDALP
jgi:hypothetical protein